MPTVREIMDADLPTVGPRRHRRDRRAPAARARLRGVAVVNEGGRCVGVVTESDLVIGDEEGDLHLPHMISLFGESSSSSASSTSRTGCARRPRPRSRT
jgi:hypothetical protein